MSRDSAYGRHALIILGMHRSGTSALAGTLARLGAEPPRTLIPATPNNPKGFWESTELMKFHDRLLAAAGSQWSDWDRFDPNPADLPALREVEAQLPALVHSEFGDARLMMIKDPRMCRLFPVWQRALRTLGVDPKVVIPFRHPEEVARSLIARNSFSRAQAQLIWLRHVLDAECFTRGMRRVFVGYAELLQDWRATVARIARKLAVHWPRHGPEVDAEIGAYLTPSLRHHAADTGRVEPVTELDAWVSDTYAALERLLADAADSSAMRDLDAIRGALDRTSAIVAPVLRDERAQMTLQLSTAKAQVAALKKSAKTAERKEREQSARIDVLAATNERLQTEVDHQAAAFGRERDGFRADIAKLTAQVAMQTDAVEVLHAQTDTLDRLAMRLALQAEAQTAARQRANLDEIHGSRAWRAIRRLRRLRRSSEEPAGEANQGSASDLALILGSGLFDTRWYLVRYPDAAACELHPATHFLRHGAEARLAPGPAFDSADYLARYPDVAQSGANPLVHFLRFGRAEGRRAVGLTS